MPFQTKFPHLYSLESVKCCLLEDRLSNNGFSWMWRYEPTGTTELNKLRQIYKHIGLMNTECASKYGFSFCLNSNGDYTVNAMRSLIESKLILSKGKSICWSTIIPLKVRCFVWRALMGRIPVADALARRGVSVTNTTCSLCNKEIEIVDHILITREYSQVVQNWIFKWCGITNIRFTSVSELIDFAATWGNCPKKKSFLVMVIYCFVWNL